MQLTILKETIEEMAQNPEVESYYANVFNMETEEEYEVPIINYGNDFFAFKIYEEQDRFEIYFKEPTVEGYTEIFRPICTGSPYPLPHYTMTQKEFAQLAKCRQVLNYGKWAFEC